LGAGITRRKAFPSSDAWLSMSCEPTSDKRSIARKMKLAAWKKEFFFELFIHTR
jgi:hypothetical protein